MNYKTVIEAVAEITGRRLTKTEVRLMIFICIGETYKKRIKRKLIRHVNINLSHKKIKILRATVNMLRSAGIIDERELLQSPSAIQSLSTSESPSPSEEAL